MTQRQFFNKVITFLNHNRIPYMVTGSVGAMRFGRPRLTNDLDVVVMLKKDQAGLFAGEFSGEDFFVPALETILDEIDRKGQFNVIHVLSGSKADFIIHKGTEFQSEEFRRRKTMPFDRDLQSYTATPEDIIISKMLFYKQGGSEKHIEDIKGILSVCSGQIDKGYIESWNLKLGLQEPWRRCQGG